MKFAIKIITLLWATSALPAVYQTWFDMLINKKIGEKIIFDFEQEWEWQAGLNDLALYFFEPILTHVIERKAVIGVSLRTNYVYFDDDPFAAALALDVDPNARVKFFDTRPSLLIQAPLTWCNFTLTIVNQFGLRVDYQSKANGFWRPFVVATYNLNSKLSVWARLEGYYNIYDTQRVDEVLGYAGFNWNPHRNFSFFSYVCNVSLKPPHTCSWANITALALGLNFSF